MIGHPHNTHQAVVRWRRRLFQEHSRQEPNKNSRVGCRAFKFRTFIPSQGVLRELFDRNVVLLLLPKSLDSCKDLLQPGTDISSGIPMFAGSNDFPELSPPGHEPHLSAVYAYSRFEASRAGRGEVSRKQAHRSTAARSCHHDALCSATQRLLKRQCIQC